MSKSAEDLLEELAEENISTMTSNRAVDCRIGSL